MPDLIGRPADAVLERLRAAGLKVAEVRYRSYPGRGRRASSCARSPPPGTA